MYGFNCKEGRVADINNKLFNFKRSLIVDGIDGCGKSTLCEWLNLWSYKDIMHQKFVDDVPCWWNSTPSSIYKRLQFYIDDNIRIMNYLKNNSRVYSMKGLLSTIAIHTFFLDRNYKKLLDRYVDIFNGEVKVLLVSCDKDVRKKRMYMREKKTEFDLITLSDEYESYYSSVVKMFSERVRTTTIDNSESKNELFLNFQNYAIESKKN